MGTRIAKAFLASRTGHLRHAYAFNTVAATGPVLRSVIPLESNIATFFEVLPNPT